MAASTSYLFEAAIHAIERMKSFTISEGFVEIDIDEIEVRLQALMQAWAHVKEYEVTLTALGDIDHVEIERKLVAAEQCYFSSYAALKKRERELAPKPVEKEAPAIAVQVNMPFAEHDVKNTWGTFDGSFTKWQGFRDRFVAAVHENGKIAPAYKFAYLKASLTGRAARTLGEWQLTGQNYCEAWARLDHVFNKQYATCRELLRTFFRLPMLRGTPRASDLQRMSNTTHETMRQLAAQGIPTDQWDMIIVHTLHEKLDGETACKWEEARTSELPTAKEICDFLERRATALESAQDNIKRESSSTSQQAIQATGRSDRAVSAATTRTQNRDRAAIQASMPSMQVHKPSNMGMSTVPNIDPESETRFSERERSLRQLPQSRSPTNGLLPRSMHQVPGKARRLQRREKEKEIDVIDEIDEIDNEDQKLWKDFKRDSLSNKEYRDKSLKNYLNCFNVIKSDRWESWTLMPTAQVRIEIDGKRYGPVRALLDTGAQPNLVSHQLQKRLCLSRQPMASRLIGIEGQPFQIKHKTTLRLSPWFDSNNSVEQEFWILPREGQWQLLVPERDLQATEKDNFPGIPWADPDCGRTGSVDLLLGCRVLAKVFRSVLGRQPQGTLCMNTIFGKIILGEHRTEKEERKSDREQIAFCVTVDNDQLHDMLKRLWEADEIRLTSFRSKEEELVEANFINTYSRDSSGRFVVTIPLKQFEIDSEKDFGSSEIIARRRFFALERKLEQDPEVREKYINFMREYEREGHMRPVTEETEGSMVYYIPHHCVTKKFRVVFDASCKTIKGVSLNEMQMLGEKLQKDLHEILMRFRRHRIAISADIKMMFRMVRIAREQWDLQRIFWRESPRERLREYWLTVVTYGMTSSAFNAVRALIQCARDAEKEFPNAARAIMEDFYMDDCTTGADSEQEAIELSKEIDYVLKGAGFDLRKWKSNSKLLVKDMNYEEKVSVIFSDDEKASILGLKWLLEKDQFTFMVKTPAIDKIMTKRKIVSCVAQLYDLNGFISPVTIYGKILIQDIWRLNVDWDEKLPKEIEERWRKFWREIMFLENMRIDRWIGTSKDAEIEVHGFSDASERAYGAVIYVRTISASGKICTSMLAAKTRVAPLKTITIPRLELAAAELLGRLFMSVKETMSWERIEYNMWTDSLVTLHWINKLPCNLKTYVANRVSSVQTNMRHVGTKDNPADLLSRGVKPSPLVDNKLWLHGPEWLSEPRTTWKSKNYVPNVSDGGRDEIREERVLTIMEFTKPLSICTKDLRERVSVIEYAFTLEKALNIVSYIFRFVNTIRERIKIRKDEERKYGKRQRRSKRQIIKRDRMRIVQPTSCEKKQAIDHLIIKEQEKYFNKEITYLKRDRSLPEKSKIDSLRPSLDCNGILRVGGRLERAEIEFERRHPAIVPRSSRLAWLIIDSAHRATKHGATQVMMQHIRERFWIPRIRSEIRNYLHKCLVCVRYNHRFEMQMMSDLPAERVNPGKAFLHTGVDYAGPFEIKMIDKALKTAFISCYERFIARRGRCERLYSDNGTAFVGAEKELRKAKELWLKRETFEHLSKKGTEWKFMTPAAPHQGGIYEAAVKSMKYHLTRIVGDRVLAYEQLLTLLTGIEAILNSRPLQPLKDDPNDLQALTPGHFLIGEPLVLPLPFVTNEMPNVHGVKLWRERERMLSHFWARWKEEYLSTLFERKKWRKEKDSVKEGQLCIIKSENFPLSAWAMGRILRVIPRKDGLVRSVVIQTATNQLTRPVQKICILPIEGLR